MNQIEYSPDHPQIESMSDEMVLELLYTALSSPIGLLLQVDNFNYTRQTMYRVRAKAADPELNRLQIRASPLEGGNMVVTKGQVGVGVGGTMAKPKPIASIGKPDTSWLQEEME